METTNTASRYVELCNERNNVDLKRFDIFVAFTEKQFEEEKKYIRPLKEGEKVYNIGGGLFGTKDGIERYSEFTSSIREKIRQECKPQDVYDYEFRNYECAIDWDGDFNAIVQVADIFGWNATHNIRRGNAYKTIEEIREIIKNDGRNN